MPIEFYENYRVEKLDQKYFLQSTVENDHFENVYFFPRYYGLTDYVAAQIYEKNENSFSLEINASKTDLELEKFEGIIEATNSKGVFYFDVNYQLALEKSKEQSLLFTDTQTTQRYNKNFSGQLGLKKESEIQILLASDGRMFGDFECIYGTPFQMTMVCYSPTATIQVLDKAELFRLQENSDTWKSIRKASERQQSEMMASFTEKLANKSDLLNS